MGSAVPKKTLVIQLLFLMVLLGCAAWLFTNLGDFGTGVKCLVDGVDTLKTVEGDAGVIAQDAVSAVPDDVLDLLKQAVPMIAALAVVPAVLIAVINLIIFICACNAKAGGSTKCTKCLIMICMLFLLIGFALYLVIGILGIAMGTAEGDEAKADVTEVCDEYIPQFIEELVTVQAQLEAAEAFGSPAQVESLQFELGEAEKAANTMKEMCDCVLDIFDTFEAFSSPGLACSFVCFLLFFINCCACCRLGAKKEVAPEAEA